MLENDQISKMYGLYSTISERNALISPNAVLSLQLDSTMSSIEAYGFYRVSPILHTATTILYQKSHRFVFFFQESSDEDKVLPHRDHRHQKNR